MELGLVVLEKMLFKEKVKGRTTDKDRSQYLTLSPAQVS